MNDWYDEIGQGYTNLRVPDIRIAKLVRHSLGDVESVANIGAGTGSYEPEDCGVIAVEPSTLMLSQYRGKGTRVQAISEAISLANDSVDASMGILTLHHWEDWRKGLAEMLRVTRNVALILTHKPDLFDFWLLDYFPIIHDIDMEKFSSISEIEVGAQACGWTTEVSVVPVPFDCTDGFLGAYWRRPEAYFDPAVRRSISTFNLLDADLVNATLDQLKSDLDSGLWDDKYGHLKEMTELDMGYRILKMTLSD